MPELAPQDIKPTAAWQDAWDGYALELELLGRSRSTISSRKSNVLAMARYFTAKGTEPEDVVAMEEPEGGWTASHYGWTSQGGWPSREAFGRFMRGEAPLISRNAPFPVAVPAAEPGQKTAPEPARPARRVPTSTGWAMVFGQPPESSGEPPLAPKPDPRLPGRLRRAESRQGRKSGRPSPRSHDEPGSLARWLG